MPRGASTKREKEYEDLKKEFKEEGRYEGREEEVASRIVNQQRAEHGETKGARLDDRKGKSPDRNLPIHNYDSLTADQITAKLDDLTQGEVRKIKEYEEHHRDRKTLREEIGRRLK